MEINGIAHIQLTVNDLQRAMPFYEEVLAFMGMQAVVKNPEGVPNAGKPRLLIQTYPLEQNLEKAVAGKHWKASPATRMMELLHATDVRLGLVTNGVRRSRLEKWTRNTASPATA